MNDRPTEPPDDMTAPFGALTLLDVDAPNPLTMSCDERLAWYDGLGAVLGLMSLVTWMHVPPLCAECMCNDAVDLVDVYELHHDDRWYWDGTRRGEPWCSACTDDAAEHRMVVVPAGANPHLLPAEYVAGMPD